MYVNANQQIQAYLNAPQSVNADSAARQAASNLSGIATRQSPFNLNPAEWVRNNNGTYHLASIEQLERAARATMEPAAD